MALAEPMVLALMIVEDDPDLAENLRVFIERNGWNAAVYGSAEEALGALDRVQPDIVLTDYRLPGLPGIDLIRRLKAVDANLQVIMMTGEGNERCAVDAMKAGAFDYLTKPVALTELKMVIEKAAEMQRMEQVLAVYRSREGGALDALIGESDVMQGVKERVLRLLDAEAKMGGEMPPTVLITGETGTGKELVARALHFDGPRRDKPYMEVNCAVIPPHLLEAELFGHEKGAFTDAKERRIGLIEAADGGTLFLDEIGEMDLALQPKLLRLMEDRKLRRLGSVRERTVDVRVVSATNRDLQQMVEEGRFRADLYYRLGIVNIQLPPLRERRDDVLALARHFLALHGRRYGKPGLVLSRECEKAILEYDWPGNVRELRNALERAVLLANGLAIASGDIELVCERMVARQADNESDGCAHITITRGRVRSLSEEREALLEVLNKTDWNVSKSARLLDITRDMLRYRIQKLGLVPPDQQPG